MKRSKRILVATLAGLMVGASATSFASCDMIMGLFNANVGEGIGRAVNLLTGDYRTIASGTTSIFDEEAFEELTLRMDTNVKKQETTITYEESVDSYLKELSTQVTNKISDEVSVGFDKLAKVTMGYSVEVSEGYKTRTYSATESVFYDMDYYYISNQVEIDGYNDLDKLSSIVTKRFKSDAQRVADGTMTAADFIKKYGTHIVTAGIYGATFNAHYEMVGHKEELSNEFTNMTKEGISAGISGKLEGIDLGLKTETSTQVDNRVLDTITKDTMQTKFSATAFGGSATPASGTKLEEFAINCSEWAKGLNDWNYVLIDVPDNSLYFVWEFLGDEYAETKDILYDYFFSVSEKEYNEKVNGLFSHFVTFEEETGVLTVDFSDLQTVKKADVNFIYDNETDQIGVDFNKGGNYDNVFTVYSKIHNIPVNKVIFKGKYGEENDAGSPIETKFNKFSIQFDKGWKDDILIEFENFGYTAPAGKAGLDFSEVQSENITINVVNKAYIKGGDGASAGADGCAGINAIEKNLMITGDDLQVFGGNGIAGAEVTAASSHGKAGANGGVGIQAKSISIEASGDFTVRGGNGGAGSSGTDSNGGNNTESGEGGGIGGAGGSGGYGISASIVNLLTGNLTINGGNGANGGNGGRGDDGTLIFEYDGDGGEGGNGGNGACAIYSTQISVSSEVKATITGGNGGNGGNGGEGGSGGIDSSAGGKGGAAGRAGAGTSVKVTTSNTDFVVVAGSAGSRGSDNHGN